MNNQNSCLFCKIIAGDVPSYPLYENDDVVVFLNIYPMSRGAALFVPKRHAEDLTDGSKEDAQALISAVYERAPGFLTALGASSYNLGMNHGKDAGQEVFHTHIHFIPRYEGQPRTFVKGAPTDQELKEVAELMRVRL